jgi:hypothetical protein
MEASRPVGKRPRHRDRRRPALSAVAILKDIFAQRGIGLDQLPAASPELLPIDEAAEAQRYGATLSDKLACERWSRRSTGEKHDWAVTECVAGRR